MSAPGSGPRVRTDHASAGSPTLKYEKLFLEEIPDVLELVAQAEVYRVEYNTIRPHEALSWNRPLDVHTGLADPTVPNWETKKFLPSP